MSANSRTRYGRAYVPDQLADMNHAVEKIMRWGRFEMTVTQGSWSGSVSQSAGTHSGADGEDLSSNEADAKEKYFRLLGGMFYVRDAIRGVWPKHVHGGRDYSSVGSRGFKQQIVQYHRRRNALANFGPDTGYRMVVFPKNIYNGYIGYVQARSDTGAYEQQTSKSKLITKMKKRQITYVVAETEVSGSRWYITLTGKCIKASRFNKIKKPSGATPERPNVTPTKPAPKPPAPTPAPKPPVAVVPVSVNLNVGTRNVIYRRYTPTGVNKPFTDVKVGLDWEKRLPLLAKDAAIAHLHFLGTQEAGTYASSEELEKAIERATGKNWENILHGDNAGDITQGALWRTDVLKFVKEGKVDLAGDDHDWMTWTRTRILANNVNLLVGVVHLEWHAGGRSSVGNAYDRRRQLQTDQALKALLRMAGPDDIVILLGDFNSTLQNPYDGPSKAALLNGFVDAEQIPGIKQVNTDFDSYHNQLTPQTDRQFDRFLVMKSQLESGKLRVRAYTVAVNSETKKGSDHYQTHISITVRTK